MSTMLIKTAAAAFQGDGTFYGAGGHGQLGACQLPVGFNGVPLTVAINQDQWEDGMTCGKCIRILPTSAGIGMTPIMTEMVATIDNLCPECVYGDIDIGADGDGRWQIEWEFIPCH
jgi:hypothetical protein